MGKIIGVHYQTEKKVKDEQEKEREVVTNARRKRRLAEIL